MTIIEYFSYYIIIYSRRGLRNEDTLPSYWLHWDAVAGFPCDYPNQTVKQAQEDTNKVVSSIKQRINSDSNESNIEVSAKHRA